MFQLVEPSKQRQRRNGKYIFKLNDEKNAGFVKLIANDYKKKMTFKDSNLQWLLHQKMPSTKTSKKPIIKGLDEKKTTILKIPGTKTRKPAIKLTISPTYTHRDMPYGDYVKYLFLESRTKVDQGLNEGTIKNIHRRMMKEKHLDMIVLQIKSSDWQMIHRETVGTLISALYDIRPYKEKECIYDDELIAKQLIATRHFVRLIQAKNVEIEKTKEVQKTCFICKKKGPCGFRTGIQRNGKYDYLYMGSECNENEFGSGCGDKMVKINDIYVALRRFYTERDDEDVYGIVTGIFMEVIRRVWE